jgi:hypothetical protein
MQWRIQDSYPQGRRFDPAPATNLQQPTALHVVLTPLMSAVVVAHFYSAVSQEISSRNCVDTSCEANV